MPDDGPFLFSNTFRHSLKRMLVSRKKINGPRSGIRTGFPGTPSKTTGVAIFTRAGVRRVWLVFTFTSNRKTLNPSADMGI